jgi:hypothetical protein
MEKAEYAVARKFVSSAATFNAKLISRSHSHHHERSVSNLGTGREATLLCHVLGSAVETLLSF